MKPQRPLHYPSRTARTLPRREHGLTLIEVLVTMVLLGVGLLGLAGLQLRGMQVNQGSTFRSQAAFLAEDLADRMRADRANVVAGNYDGTYQVATGAPAAVSPLFFDWLYRMSSLPGGCAQVATNMVNSYPQVTITVTWDDTRATRAADQNAVVAAAAACPQAPFNAGVGSYFFQTEMAP